MRVVVDTNVFVSAALRTKSSPALAVYLAERRRILLKSTATEQELLQVVARPQLAHLISPPFLDWLSGMLAAAELVTITERVTECRDPKDNKFLELALNGGADDHIRRSRPAGAQSLQGSPNYQARSLCPVSDGLA
jgi:putative PIN family toxin of toxin-antitoxin system